MSETKEFKPLDVGASERVPWKTAKGLAKNIGFKEDGSIEVGKDLEVDGYAKVNGGATFCQGQIRILEVLTTESDNTTTPVGYIIGNIDNISPDNDWVDFAGGMYLDGSGSIYNIAANEITTKYVDSDKIVTYADQIELIKLNELLFNPIKTLFGNQSIVGEGNIDLYRHTIQVSGDGYEAYFDYISSNSLVCDSVTDLKTLMVGTSDSQIEKIPTTLVHNVSGTIETIPGYVGVTTFFAIFSKDGRPAVGYKIADITTVADKVTTI